MIHKPHHTDPWLGRWPLVAYQQAKGVFDPIVRQANAERRRRKRFFSELFRRGDLVFGIGANHGLRSRHFLELGARVVAVEPQPHCAIELRSSLERHPRFRLEEVALGATPGTLTLRICENCDVLTTALPPQEMAARFNDPQFHWREHTVPMTTLDALIGKYGLPSFCKIDVEGYEEQVLAACRRAALSVSGVYDGHAPHAGALLPKAALAGGLSFPLLRGRYAGLAARRLAAWEEIRRHLEQLGRSNPDLWGDVYMKRA